LGHPASFNSRPYLAFLKLRVLQFAIQRWREHGGFIAPLMRGEAGPGIMELLLRPAELADTPAGRATGALNNPVMAAFILDTKRPRRFFQLITHLRNLPTLGKPILDENKLSVCDFCPTPAKLKKPVKEESKADKWSAGKEMIKSEIILLLNDYLVEATYGAGGTNRLTKRAPATISGFHSRDHVTHQHQRLAGAHAETQPTPVTLCLVYYRHLDHLHRFVP
jgi:hypothetical protein